MIAWWAKKIKTGSELVRAFCLTGIIATCTSIVDAELPEGAAEDRFDCLPVLLGQQTDDQPVRLCTIHQTISLALAVRSGKW